MVQPLSGQDLKFPDPLSPTPGTEWQSVLDVTKHGENIHRKQTEAVIEKMKAYTAVLRKYSECYLEAV
ncbi:uncharacterized protein F5891DRAFT_1187435 [Suillus fuscotomentosus]|uniref:Uncharacterized protein n=1 Tax=Suillus fuscotomentosus TaxID=1912939 RepID=A0AAD4EAS7_9AGAM|nr:uncharacterized protein F5891DRAFT_1187435 [Suillus fuscotomentosus]KAG1901579.1 hypothetical protein F5891DRAFT_1187435 [Suillus fuscotomentosus]